MQLPSRIRDSLNSAKVRTQVAIDRFDDWTEETLTLANLRAAHVKLWQVATRKDFITAAHFSGLKKTLRTGTSLTGQAVGGIGRGWVSLNEKADSAYQAVSRPVAMAGLGLIYGSSAKIDAKRYQREQNKLLRQSAEIASQLRELAKHRPGFTFEEQLQPDARTGYNKVVFTTNLPNNSNPDAASTITVSHKGIETWGLGAKMGNKTMSQMKRLLGAFMPEPTIEPFIYSHHEFDMGMPIPVAQPPAWMKDVVKPTAPADPVAYQAKQDKLSAQEERVTEQLTRMKAQNPGFAFETRRMFDEHHGTSKIVITTNIAARGKEAKPSDKLMLILSPEASDNGKLRIAGFSNGGSNEGNEAHTLSALQKIAAITYPAPKQPASAVTAPTPEPAPAAAATTAEVASYAQKAPVTQGFHSSNYKMPDAIKIAAYNLSITTPSKPAPTPAPAAAETKLSLEQKASRHFDAMAKVNPNFHYRPVPLEGGVMVITNIPAENNAGNLRFVMLPELTAKGQAMINNSHSTNEQLMPCHAALNELSRLSLERLPVTEPEYADGKKVPVLRQVYCFP